MDHNRINREKHRAAFPSPLKIIVGILCWMFLLAACTPTIKVQAPSEPITINLNVKIEHEIRIRVEKDLDALFKAEEDLF